MPDTESLPIGALKTIIDFELEIARLRWVLHRIVSLESCLLADAQEIAKEALRERE